MTIGHLHFRTPDKYSEIAFQVYPSLAYGFTGFQTFTYWTLLGEHTETQITHGVIHQDGRLTPTFFAIREVISEVKFFEKEFCSYKWQKVLCVNADDNKPNIFFSGLKHAAESLDEISSISTTADIIVGEFAGNNGAAALLFSNISDPQYEEGAKICVKFKGKKSWTVYYRNTVTEYTDNGEPFRLYLSSGSGAFVVFNQ